MTGKLLIISGPSGTGKTTIVKHLLDSGFNFSFSVSATTRGIRGDEIEGKDYFFLTVPEFMKRVENNEFVEWEEVYPNLMYGTLKSEIERIWFQGNNVIFDVDVKGGLRLKEKFGARSLAIFIMPPSIEELEKRLVKRGTDCPSKINTRILKAKDEIKLAEKFDKIIINDELDNAKKTAYELALSFLER